MISDSVIQTLTYSDHFGFPLTAKEIYLRLIQTSCSRSSLQQTLRSMIKTHQIVRTGEYYHLPRHRSLITRRESHAKISRSLLVRAKSLASQLSPTHGLLAVYLTGSLAVANADLSADIDFMLITDRGQLWTTRLLLTLYTEFFRLRRHPGSPHNSGKLCLNLYLTPDSYLLPPAKRSLYTAYELIQAVPLYDPYDTHSALLAANPWINQYLPNFRLPKKSPQPVIHPRTPSIFENIAYHLQRLYMRKKLTREYVTQNAAFFHPDNPGEKVLRKLSL